MSADEFPSGLLVVIVDEIGMATFVERGKHETQFKGIMADTRRMFRANRIRLQKHSKPVVVDNRRFWAIEIIPEHDGNSGTYLFRSKRSWEEQYAWLTKLM